MCFLLGRRRRVMEAITVCYLYTFNEIRKKSTGSCCFKWNNVEWAGPSLLLTSYEFTSQYPVIVIYLSTQKNPIAQPSVDTCTCSGIIYLNVIYKWFTCMWQEEQETNWVQMFHPWRAWRIDDLWWYIWNIISSNNFWEGGRKFVPLYKSCCAKISTKILTWLGQCGRSRGWQRNTRTHDYAHW